MTWNDAAPSPALPAPRRREAGELSSEIILERESARIRLRAWGAGALAATFAGIYCATQVRFVGPEAFRRSWTEALALSLPFYYLWALALPLVRRLIIRFPLEPPHWRKNALVHIEASIGVTLAEVFLNVLVLRALVSTGQSSLAESLVKTLRYNFHAGLATYWLMLAGNSAWLYYQRYRQRDILACQLEAELAAVRFNALRARLDPRFLFEAIDSIQSLMYRDVEAADRMMSNLSDILRTSLRREPS